MSRCSERLRAVAADISSTTGDQCSCHSVSVPLKPCSPSEDVPLLEPVRLGGPLRNCGHRPRKGHRYLSGNPIDQQSVPFVDSSIHYADAAHQCAGKECPEGTAAGCPIVDQ